MKKEYVITDGTRFIKSDINGRFIITTNISIADIWKTKKTAESVLHNSVPPHMRFSFYVAEVKDGYVIGEDTVSEERAFECKKRVTAGRDDKTYTLTKYSFNDDAKVQDMIEGFESVQRVLRTYANDDCKRKLDDNVMIMNYVVEDLKHYHGRKFLNARDGYKLNRLEDEAIVKRISVKNQSEILKIINKHYSSIISQIDDICKTIDEIRNQVYKPRVLNELFEYDNLDEIYSKLRGELCE